MDPSTTLVTFLLRTDPAIQSVSLIGSWDNFVGHYPMERDYRRGKGQWKGCHIFRDIPCNGDSSRTTSGGLTMGNTYYFYYEVDGSTETFDPAMPSTNTCPYLPGQTINTLAVPVQNYVRQRSASLSSMRITDFQTIDPGAKFVSPRPAPMASTDATVSPKRSAPGLLRNAASSRSLSPSPVWRRFFGHKFRDAERGRSSDRDGPTSTPASLCSSRSATSSRSRNRSISPESLRRFLSDDHPPRPDSNLSERPTLIIPEDIAEDNEDDDNFATSAPLDSPTFPTGLSPPPSRRPTTSGTTPLTMKNLSTLTLTTERPRSRNPANQEFRRETPNSEASLIEPSSYAQSFDFTSVPSSALASPLTTSTPEDEMLTISDAEEDLGANDLDIVSVQRPSLSRSRFTGYSLPAIVEGDKLPKASALLQAPTDTGATDFAAEMGWAFDSIGIAK